MELLSTLLGYVETRQWAKAWSEYERLSADSALRASPRLLLMGSHAANGLGNLFMARKLAELALSRFHMNEPPKLLGQIRFHLGMITQRIGDMAVSLEQFTLFLREMPIKYPELVMGESKAHYYLGLVYMDRRQPSDARDSMTRAADTARRDGLESVLRAANEALSWILITLGELDRAEACMDEYRHLCQTQEDIYHLRLNEGYLAYRRGHHQQCAEIIGQLFLQVNTSGQKLPPSVEAQACWILGMSALDEGRLDSAFGLSQIAITAATEAGVSRLMNLANQLKSPSYQVASDRGLDIVQITGNLQVSEERREE